MTPDLAPGEVFLLREVVCGLVPPACFSSCFVLRLHAAVVNVLMLWVTLGREFARLAPMRDTWLLHASEATKWQVRRCSDLSGRTIRTHGRYLNHRSKNALGR